MPEPVKTLILRAIKDAVEGLSIVGTVRRNPPSPPKRETAQFPAVYIYDDTESKSNRNRVSRNQFVVQVETYFLAESDEASDQADLVDSEVYKILMGNEDVLEYALDIKPEEGNSTSKQFLDEFMAVVVSRYVINYAHAWGDPTNQAKNP